MKKLFLLLFVLRFIPVFSQNIGINFTAYNYRIQSVLDTYNKDTRPYMIDHHVDKHGGRTWTWQTGVSYTTKHIGRFSIESGLQLSKTQLQYELGKYWSDTVWGFVGNVSEYLSTENYTNYQLSVPLYLKYNIIYNLYLIGGISNNFIIYQTCTTTTPWKKVNRYQGFYHIAVSYRIYNFEISAGTERVFTKFNKTDYNYRSTAYPGVAYMEYVKPYSCSLTYYIPLKKKPEPEIHTEPVIIP